MTILIVDDMEENILHLKDLLSKEGFEIFTASDGVEALSILQKSKVDFIVSDINMPMMDGLTLAKEVRTKDKDTPFYLYTRSAAEPYLQHLAEEIGANRLISIKGIKEIKEAVMERFTKALDENLKVTNQFK